MSTGHKKLQLQVLDLPQRNFGLIIAVLLSFNKKARL